MKRLLSCLLIVLLITSLAACSHLPIEPVDETLAPLLETSAPAATTDVAVPPATYEPIVPEPKAYVPMDIFSSEFNPYGDMELPDIFTVFAASFSRGSAKLEGKNPYTLYMTGSGNMFAAVAYHADVAGLTEDEKNAHIDEYLDGGFCEFVGVDGRVVTIRQTDPNDNRYEYVDGGCLIEIAFNVNTTDLAKYTNLVRDNYNMNALASVKEYIDIETDFSECSIEVNLQNKETVVAVQYYVDDAEAVKQRVAEYPKSEWGEWYGLPSASIPYGMIRNTLVFDSRFGAAVLILQTSNELNTALDEYIEPEFSLTKFGFGFDQDGVCGVYEQHEPYYMNVAIHRPEWGEFNEDWNIEYLDQVNGYGLRITYFVDEDRYHITVDKNNESAAFDYLPATKEYIGQYPDGDTVKRMFNDAFSTQGEEFYEKPMAYFEQLVQERFGMSIDELYTLPVQ